MLYIDALITLKESREEVLIKLAPYLLFWYLSRLHSWIRFENVHLVQIDGICNRNKVIILELSNLVHRHWQLWKSLKKGFYLNQ